MVYNGIKKDFRSINVMQESKKRTNKINLRGLFNAFIFATAIGMQGICSFAEEAVVTDNVQEIQSVDYETQLLIAAQAQVVAQGINLNKYHVINILGDSLTEGVGACR